MSIPARHRIYALFPVCDSLTEADAREAELDRLLDAYRAEILAEADLLPKKDVVAWLTKKAREGTPVELLASKADRGAIRPDNLRLLPAKFFEADRTYRRGIYEFRCLAVTTDPRSGEARAVGLRSRGGWPWVGAALDPDDWEHGGWTDITDTTTGDSK
ncbi:hypothetical protein ACJWDR_37820 [Streptomyces tauricus]|uniref:hypothetical protein n=1 Tax=Streptomyces tauricus TaxID=68274 RepID=UPI00387F26F7